jgi:hypothetical protein
MGQWEHIGKIALAGISFAESSRLSSFQPEIKKTLTTLSSLGIDVDQKLVLFQTGLPKNFSNNYRWKLSTIVRTSVVGARIFLNLELKSASKNPILGGLSVVRYFARLLLNFKSLLIRLLKNPNSLWNEAQLSSKHTWAWRYFINNQDLDLLIVLEDDAVSFGDLSKQLAISIQTFHNLNSYPQYFDLGPHYDYAKTYTRAGLMMSCNSGVAVAPFIANTTVAYAVNRSFVETILTELKVKPGLENVSADWMVMELVRRAQKRGMVFQYRFLECEPVYMNTSLLAGESTLGNI